MASVIGLRVNRRHSERDRPSSRVPAVTTGGASMCEGNSILGFRSSLSPFPHLMAKLEAFVHELRASGMVRAIIVNGSFVTNKEAPNDIDLLIVLPAGHDFRADLTPTQYRIVVRRRVKRVYGVVVEEDSADYAALIRRAP